MAQKFQIGGLSRRTVSVLIPASLAALAWVATRPTAPALNPMARVAPFVKPKARWTANDFFEFLEALPPPTMLELKKSLGVLAADASQDRLAGMPQDARDIQSHALWVSSNIFEYPFRDETKLNYHSLVTWVGSAVGVARNIVETASSFALERELLRALFA